MAVHIYIVEDDKNIREIEMFALKNSGYVVEEFENAKTFFSRITEKVPDLVLLDIMLPDMDGLEIVKKLRSRPDTVRVPIILVTAKTTELDKVKGLDIGADDYLTKPFSVEELLARLRVVERRMALMNGEAQTAESVYTNGRLRIDFAAGCAYMGDKELHLTSTEYKLLCLMAKNTGKVLTHTYITQKVWGSSWENDIASLRVFMATLRKKLENGKDGQQYIQTHIGIGYRMLRVE